MIPYTFEHRRGRNAMSRTAQKDAIITGGPQVWSRVWSRPSAHKAGAWSLPPAR
jgi:hypothetical protein